MTGLRCSVCPLRALLGPLLPADPPVKVTVLQVDFWVPERRDAAPERLDHLVKVNSPASILQLLIEHF